MQVDKAVDIFNTMRTEGCQMNTAPRSKEGEFDFDR